MKAFYIKTIFLHGRFKQQPVSLVHAVMIDSHERRLFVNNSNWDRAASAPADVLSISICVGPFV